MIEDEFHVLFECPSYSFIRTKFQNTLFDGFGVTITDVVRQLKHVPSKVCEVMDQLTKKGG